MRTIYDRENAPTETLAKREHHRIATLGYNAIIRNYRTRTLEGRERVTKLSPKTKRPRQVISAAIRKIFRVLKHQHSSQPKGDFKI